MLSVLMFNEINAFLIEDLHRSIFDDVSWTVLVMKGDLLSVNQSCSNWFEEFHVQIIDKLFCCDVPLFFHYRFQFRIHWEFWLIDCKLCLIHDLAVLRTKIQYMQQGLKHWSSFILRSTPSGCFWFKACRSLRPFPYGIFQNTRLPHCFWTQQGVWIMDHPSPVCERKRPCCQRSRVRCWIRFSSIHRHRPRFRQISSHCKHIVVCRWSYTFSSLCSVFT